MATGLVIHISSGENKHTEILTDRLIQIGRTEACNLQLPMADLPEQGAEVVLELQRKSGTYRIANFDSTLGMTVNRQPITSDAEVKDGDEVRFNKSRLTLHFYPIRSLPAVIGAPRTHEAQVAPFIEHAAIESAATARRDDAKVFLREFTRELVREINPSTKLITLAIAVALVGGILYIGFSMFQEMQRSRRVIDEQRAQLTSMKDQVSKTNETLSNLDRSNKEIRDSLSLAVKLRSDYGGGVCLIAGSFYYVEAGTGRPLRYAESQMNESGGQVQNAGEPTTLTPEGKAAVAEFEFVGTGFYVGDGFVITNRHIAQPWLADERAQSLVSSVRVQPRLKKLNAYFPEHSQPIPLKFKVAGKRDDLAVCLLDIKDLPTDIPVLPLETDVDAVAVGKTVVMMGYPLGPDRLLAFLEDAEARNIQQRYQTLDSILDYLASTRRIQPQTTQGNITDLDVRRIVYDARTAEGGSGAPVFGPTGRVIGVNFAILTGNQASNFAAPIQYGVTLLQSSGWKFPPTEDLKEAETSTSPQN
jgi:serine protease Do